MKEREAPIEVTNEKLKALRFEDMEYEWEDDSQFQDLHYSRKGSHKMRSIANDPHKRSRRR